jgi:hypothetical protein
MALCGRMPAISAPTRRAFYQEEFVVGERAGLVQNAFGHEDFADVVDARGIDQIGGFFRRQAQSPRKNFGVARHQVAVAGGAQLAGFHGAAENFNRFLQQRHVAVFFAAAEFHQHRGQFFEMLRPVVLALQKAFDVGGNLLALRGELLAPANSSAADTRLPPERFETYMPASATRMMSSMEKPCMGKLATPKLPVMWCSLSMGSLAIHCRRRSARTCACSGPVSGMRIMNSSPP